MDTEMAVCEAANEYDDTGYRDMLLELYEKKLNTKSLTHSSENNRRSKYCACSGFSERPWPTYSTQPRSFSNFFSVQNTTNKALGLIDRQSA